MVSTTGIWAGVATAAVLSVLLWALWRNMRKMGRPRTRAMTHPSEPWPRSSEVIVRVGSVLVTICALVTLPLLVAERL